MFTLGKNDVHIKYAENLKQCLAIRFLAISSHGPVRELQSTEYSSVWPFHSPPLQQNGLTINNISCYFKYYLCNLHATDFQNTYYPTLPCEYNNSTYFLPLQGKLNAPLPRLVGPGVISGQRSVGEGHGTFSLS